MCIKKKVVSDGKKKRGCRLSNGSARFIVCCFGVAGVVAGSLGVGRLSFITSYITQDYGIIAFLGGLALLAGAFIHYVFDIRGSAAVSASHRVATDPRAAAAVLELAKMATISQHALEALEHNTETHRIIDGLTLTVGPILAELEPIADDYGARVVGWPAEGGEKCALKRAKVEPGDRIFSLGEKTLWKDLFVEVVRELRAIKKITPLYVSRAISEEEQARIRAALKAAKKAGAKEFGDARKAFTGMATAVRKAANVLKVMVRLDVPGGEPLATQKEAPKSGGAGDMRLALYLPP
jgi:hypothetical protein